MSDTPRDLNTGLRDLAEIPIEQRNQVWHDAADLIGEVDRE